MLCIVIYLIVAIPSVSAFVIYTVSVFYQIAIVQDRCAPDTILHWWLATAIAALVAKPVIDIFSSPEGEDNFDKHVAYLLCTQGAIGVIFLVINPTEHAHSFKAALLGVATLIGYSLWKTTTGSTWMSIAKAMGVFTVTAVLCQFLFPHATQVVKRIWNKTDGRMETLLTLFDDSVDYYIFSVHPEEVKPKEKEKPAPPRSAGLGIPNIFGWLTRSGSADLPEIIMECGDQKNESEIWFRRGYNRISVILKGDGTCQIPFPRPTSESGQVSQAFYYKIGAPGSIQTLPYYKGGREGEEYLDKAGVDHGLSDDIRGFKLRPTDREPVRLTFLFR